GAGSVGKAAREHRSSSGQASVVRTSHVAEPVRLSAARHPRAEAAAAMPSRVARPLADPGVVDRPDVPTQSSVAGMRTSAGVSGLATWLGISLLGAALISLVLALWRRLGPPPASRVGGEAPPMISGD